MKRFVKLFCVVGFLGIPVITGAQPVAFSTSIRNYAYVGKPGLNSDPSIISLFTTSAPASAGGGFSSGTTVSFTNGTAQNLNGTGINEVDGFMYGSEYVYAGPNSTVANFYRIGANAVAEKVGIIPGPTTADAGRPIQFSFVNTASGMVDNAGDYWFTGYTFTDLNAPYSGSKVDFFVGKVPAINTLSAGTPVLTPTYYKLDISDPILQQGYSNFISAVVAWGALGAPSNANGGWQDMDINPADGKFYSYIAFPSAPTAPGPTIVEPPLNSYLVKIDPVNTGGYWGKVTLVNTTENTNPDYEADGAYFDQAGDYYVLFTNGEYGQVNLTNGTLGPLSMAALPLNGGQMRGDLATNTPVTPLPVRIVSFRGTQITDGVLLNWKMAETADLESIEIQRSEDATHFNSLATLIWSGEQNGYTDAAPIETAYYRLKLNEKNGAAFYSNTLMIANGRTTDIATNAYPNPVNNILTIRTQAPSVKVSLTNRAGMAVISGVYKNENRTAVDIAIPATLIAGNYILSVEDATSGKVLLNKQISRQ